MLLAKGPTVTGTDTEIKYLGPKETKPIKESIVTGVRAQGSVAC